MMTLETLVSFFSRKSIISTAYPALLILPFIALAGCTNDGAGGPTISSLSTPTDATTGLDSDQIPQSEATDSDGEEDPVITMTSTPTGVIAHVTWDRPPDINVARYNVYYRKQPPAESSSEESGSEESASEESGLEEPSSCSSGQRQTVEGPSATIVGLEPDTRYVFAIHAFNENESESLCSNEVMVVTPSAES
jgi:Fibronectin type III domain